MTVSTKVAPPNSVLLIEDSSGGEVPVSMSRSLVAATASCIAIGCRPEDDGETEISLGRSQEMGGGEQLVFEGSLRTPSRRLAVRTVYGATLLDMTVQAAETTVRIWANDPSEPDRIGIGIIG